MTFDPFQQRKRSLSWVNINGENCRSLQPGIPAENVLSAGQNGDTPSIKQLKFQDPKQFVAGRLNENVHNWNFIFEQNSTSQEIRDWVGKGVDLRQYIRPFRGSFRGIEYNHDFPPQRIFNNSAKCIPFTDFINNTIMERLCNGSIECVGKVGEVDPPYIVSPLTIEPSKPRLCINLMYLNNWVIDIPFSLDTLKDVPRATEPNAYYTSIDDKSGFDNLKLKPGSGGLVAFQWGGYYFQFLTIPFGLKLSSYFYNQLNLQPTSYIRRKFLIPMFLYIDDRLIEMIRDKRGGNGYQRAAVANYIVCEILLRLGYCINIEKSVFVPTQKPVFLGFIVDSVNSCFRLTNEKKKKFANLRDFCLSGLKIKVLDLQRLAGRCISFLLVVPGAKLYIREMNLAISFGLKAGSSVPLTLELKEELEAWKFLDTWEGKLEWKRERHISLELFSDSSKFKWGGVVNLPKNKIEISDFWVGGDLDLNIMTLETKALLNVLRSVRAEVRGHRVDAYVDNKVLISAWENEGTRSRELNTVLKQLFNFVLEYDIVLKLYYVESRANPADKPSRALQKSDAMISQSVWSVIQEQFGEERGHSLDLMSLDSNCMRDKQGRPMRHFTPFRTPNSSGVNMFAQAIRKNENCYVHPPFTIINPVVKFIVENQLKCTLVIPSTDITPIWLPLVHSSIEDALVIGYKGQKHILKYPTKKGFINDKHGLKSNLWAIRLGSGTYPDTYGKLLFSECPGVGTNAHLVICGDSMVRFAEKRPEFSSPLVKVSARGGGLISEVQRDIGIYIRRFAPKIMLVHVGVNNVSKAYLYPSEYMQIACALDQTKQLEQALRKFSMVYQGVKIILSAIVVTKDGFINARSNIVNEQIQSCCRRNNWVYMDNHNLKAEMLRDSVHLNKQGEDMFIHNIMANVKAVLT